MNHITRLNAELAAANAKVAEYETELRILRNYMQSGKFQHSEFRPWDATDTMVQANDIVHIIDQINRNAQEAENAAWHNAVGPKPEPSRNGWICPECRQSLQDEYIWNDTDAKAAERMRLHWIESHSRQLAG